MESTREQQVDGTASDFVCPLVNREEMLQCSFPKWYSRFEKVTPLSFIVDLPDDFVEYLLSDGTIRLPGKPYEWKKSSKASDDEESDSWSDIEEDDAGDKGATDVPKFEELSRRVTKKIRKLGGRCFPKLDWSSPKDASWIGLNNSLSCSTFIDVCLLLKSSTFVSHDLTQPFEFCRPPDSTAQQQQSPDSTAQQQQSPGDNSQQPTDPNEPSAATHAQAEANNSDSDQTGSSLSSKPDMQFHLVLRKWVEIEPSFEFRCFVRNKRLVSISQREISQFYGYIGEQRDQIVGDILSFYREFIAGNFPLENFVFDVFRPRKDYVRLLDFNAFCAQTDPLLFTWKELFQPSADLAHHTPLIEDVAADNNDRRQVDSAEAEEEAQSRVDLSTTLLPEFRFHRDGDGIIRPSDLRNYGLPVDVVQFATASSTQKLIDLMQIQDRTATPHNSDSSEED